MCRRELVEVDRRGLRRGLLRLLGCLGRRCRERRGNRSLRRADGCSLWCLLSLQCRLALGDHRCLRLLAHGSARLACRRLGWRGWRGCLLLRRSLGALCLLDRLAVLVELRLGTRLLLLLGRGCLERVRARDRRGAASLADRVAMLVELGLGSRLLLLLHSGNTRVLGEEELDESLGEVLPSRLGSCVLATRIGGIIRDLENRVGDDVLECLGHLGRGGCVWFRKVGVCGRVNRQLFPRTLSFTPGEHKSVFELLGKGIHALSTPHETLLHCLKRKSRIVSF